MCSKTLAIDSDPFDLAGTPTRLVIEGAAGAGQSTAMSLTPNEWQQHAMLSLFVVTVVDTDGVRVQRPLAGLVSERGEREHSPYPRAFVDSVCGSVQHTSAYVSTSQHTSAYVSMGAFSIASISCRQRPPPPQK